MNRAAVELISRQVTDQTRAAAPKKPVNPVRNGRNWPNDSWFGDAPQRRH
ncbi:hypothetical protein [Kibdelosporangium philippinense]